jgi:hypothetical protein
VNGQIEHSRFSWEDNIKINSSEILLGYGPDSAESGQDRVNGSCEHGKEISRSIQGNAFLE